MIAQVKRMKREYNRKEGTMSEEEGKNINFTFADP